MSFTTTNNSAANGRAWPRNACISSPLPVDRGTKRPQALRKNHLTGAITNPVAAFPTHNLIPVGARNVIGLQGTGIFACVFDSMVMATGLFSSMAKF